MKKAIITEYTYAQDATIWNVSQDDRVKGASRLIRWAEINLERDDESVIDVIMASEVVVRTLRYE